MLRRTGFVRKTLERKPPSLPRPIRQTAKTVIIDTVAASPKEPPPVRDKRYRELVASLECYHCRIWQQSQAAHPNTGKTKGKKLSDLLVFPMCTVGGRDCHGKFDRYELIKRAEMPAYERKAYVWTVKTLLARGLWPKRLAVPTL